MAYQCAGALQRAKGKPLVKVSTRTMDMVIELDNEAERDDLVNHLTPLTQQASIIPDDGSCQGPSQLEIMMSVSFVGPASIFVG